VKIPVAKYDDGMVMASTERVPLQIKRRISSKTWSILSGTIILDPTDEEEDLSEGRIHVITDESNVVGIWKSGKPISPQECYKLIESALEKRQTNFTPGLFQSD
jgi:exosome complex RNA-binding protein Rrp42 (RNase PH superfamily)